ncbi:hydroxymethylglutaryl-CoA reductase [Aspergillus alliaceus]|uniref:3-hydroxy-3-methylglutaryl coenzyme A reductase n=1 Tax=Petromyces alliaceus TaxID=209559 RepID=A0A5N7BQZ0_PETAA|nr:hydroxymethylglutaryl-CoA reductase [Aspergillus alliaceus]
MKMKDLDKKALVPGDAVVARRAILSAQCRERGLPESIPEDVPYLNYDYEDVVGSCCENVIGYMPIPLGLAGQLILDGHEFVLPMATTEGALIASVARGCKAINASGGATTALTADAITRAPCLWFPSLSQASEAKVWLESTAAKTVISGEFKRCSKHCTLINITVTIVGNLIYPRFVATTGDAMGMNMISKCVQRAILAMKHHGFDGLQLVALSGNMCSDKKATAVNWIEGRGKSVIAQCRVSSVVVEEVLKTNIAQLVALNTAKNYVGSAVAGALGGFNAHASNIVSAIFLATGQDIAQNVESSQCITTMEQVDNELVISVTMPSVVVGTVGGGTQLKPQASMLKLLGVQGASMKNPGQNSQQLARIVVGAVLAGELSLCSALASDDLVQSHMQLNRKEQA